MSHIHAELILKYVLDARETKYPWARWEYYSELSKKWKPLDSMPRFDEKTKYRRKETAPQVAQLQNEEKKSVPIRNKNLHAKMKLIAEFRILSHETGLEQLILEAIPDSQGIFEHEVTKDYYATLKKIDHLINEVRQKGLFNPEGVWFSPSTLQAVRIEAINN